MNVHICEMVKGKHTGTQGKSGKEYSRLGKGEVIEKKGNPCCGVFFFFLDR